MAWFPVKQPQRLHSNMRVMNPSRNHPSVYTPKIALRLGMERTTVPVPPVANNLVTSGGDRLITSDGKYIIFY